MLKIEEYLKRKVFEYCDRNPNGANIYKVQQKMEKEFWNVSAMLYGAWLRENSTLETGTELSEQEW
ncbi:MAG: hypothetical protein VX541_03365 [Candidatus Poribacteria bacterium]|nr:hypothetical protein [Candidatus Poribacteria bacterium]